MHHPSVPYNKLLTNLASSSRTGEYWPSVVLYGPRCARSVLPRPRANIPRYGPRARLVRGYYGQRIKRRATYLLRTFIHIKSLKFSFGLSAQPRAIEFLWQKVWVNLAEEFLGEISKPLTSKDLAFVTIRYDDIYDRHDTKLRSHDLEKSGKKNNTRVKEISHI